MIASQDEIIELDVSGTSIKTSLRLLRKVPHSQLAKLFFEPWNLKKTKDDKIFIDRDPRFFGHMLQYLRNDFRPLKLESEYDQQELAKELEFWQVTKDHHPKFIELKKIFETQPDSKC